MSSINEVIGAVHERLGRFAQSARGQAAADVATILLYIDQQRQARLADLRVLERQSALIKELRATVARQDATIKGLSFGASVRMRVAS